MMNYWEDPRDIPPFPRPGGGRYWEDPKDIPPFPRPGGQTYLGPTKRRQRPSIFPDRTMRGEGDSRPGLFGNVGRRLKEYGQSQLERYTPLASGIMGALERRWEEYPSAIGEWGAETFAGPQWQSALQKWGDRIPKSPADILRQWATSAQGGALNQRSRLLGSGEGLQTYAPPGSDPMDPMDFEGVPSGTPLTRITGGDPVLSEVPSEVPLQYEPYTPPTEEELRLTDLAESGRRSGMSEADITSMIKEQRAVGEPDINPLALMDRSEWNSLMVAAYDVGLSGNDRRRAESIYNAQLAKSAENIKNILDKREAVLRVMQRLGATGATVADLDETDRATVEATMREAGFPVTGATTSNELVLYLEERNDIYNEQILAEETVITNSKDAYQRLLNITPRQLIPTNAAADKWFAEQGITQDMFERYSEAQQRDILNQYMAQSQKKNIIGMDRAGYIQSLFKDKVGEGLDLTLEELASMPVDTASGLMNYWRESEKDAATIAREAGIREEDLARAARIREDEYVWRIQNERRRQRQWEQELDLQRQAMEPRRLGAEASNLLSGLFPNLNLSPEQLAGIPQGLLGVLIQAMMAQRQSGQPTGGQLFGAGRGLFAPRRQRVE